VPGTDRGRAGEAGGDLAGGVDHRGCERVEGGELIGILLGGGGQGAGPQLRALAAGESGNLDEERRRGPAARDRARGGREGEAAELGLEEIEPIACLARGGERVDVLDERHDTEQPAFAREDAQLTLGAIAIAGDRAGIDREDGQVVLAGERGDERAPARAHCATQDREARCGLERLVDRTDHVRRGFQLLELEVVGLDEPRESCDLRVEAGLAVNEREDPPRELQRVAMLGCVLRVAIGALDEAEAAECSLGAELGPRARIGEGAVDDAADRVEGRVGDLLGVELANPVARGRAQLVRDERPQDLLLGGGQLEPVTKPRDRGRQSGHGRRSG